MSNDRIEKGVSLLRVMERVWAGESASRRVRPLVRGPLRRALRRRDAVTGVTPDDVRRGSRTAQGTARGGKSERAVVAYERSGTACIRRAPLRGEWALPTPREPTTWWSSPSPRPNDGVLLRMSNPG